MKKATQNHAATSLNKLNLLDEIEENRVILWFSDNWQKLLIFFLLGFFLLFGLYAWNARGLGKAEMDYYDVDQVFQNFQAGGEGSREAFEKLTQILERRPDLHAKYDGLIAQTLINRSDIAEAELYASASLKRISADHLSDYIDYSKTSLLTVEHQTAEALQRSLALKQRLLKRLQPSVDGAESLSFGSTLFAINLLRIAMLEQQAGSENGELDAWKEWMHYMQGGGGMAANEFDNKAFFTLANGLVVGKLSLLDYINHRMQKLQ